MDEQNTSTSQTPIEASIENLITTKKYINWKKIVTIILFAFTMFTAGAFSGRNYITLENTNLPLALQPPPSLVQQPTQISQKITNSPTTTIKPTINVEEKLGGIIFHLADVKVGDQIGAMQITDITKAAYSSDDLPDYATISFTGQITIKGEYPHWLTTQKPTCFKVDDKSESLFPRLSSDNRVIWFCFNDSTLLDSEFPVGTQGEAEIIIDNYKIHFAPTQVYNSADLVKVISKTQELVK